MPPWCAWAPWDVPDERLLGREILAVVGAAVAGLPAAQRQAITLRDLEGWSADEVCTALVITPRRDDRVTPRSS